MMLKRLLKVSVLSMALVGSVEAQSNLTIGRTLVAGGVSYTNFTVTTVGVFDLWTTSTLGTGGTTPFDPVMYLFAGTGTGGALYGVDDDGCGASAALLAQCGPSVSFSNSILNNFALGLGAYTVAVGGFALTEAEARSGVNSGNTFSGGYNLRIASLEEFGGGGGVATASVVPEPSSFALLAAGMFGVGMAARRRRRAA